MKKNKLWTAFALLCIPFQLLTVELNSRACHCQPPRQGAPGVPGESNFVDAFGSDYTFVNGVFNLQPLPFELVNSNVNVIHIPVSSLLGSQLQIVESGNYFVFFGASMASFDGDSLIGLFVNGNEIPGTRLDLVPFTGGLTNIAIILPLNVGDLVDIRSLTNNGSTDLGTSLNPFIQAVTVQINLIRLGPLLNF